jgi:hypothetical protein
MEGKITLGQLNDHELKESFAQRDVMVGIT